MDHFDAHAVAAEGRAHGKLYTETVRVPALSAGVYALPAGARDPQSPHREDEVYCVLSGRARLWVEGREVEVGPGSVVYVEASAEHRFHDVVEDLTVLVLFAPAETEPT